VPARRGSVGAMKPDLATRLAAVVGNRVSVVDADAIVREFLAQIVRCLACDDTGSITVGHDVSIATWTALGNAVVDPVIAAGTVGPCPTCGGKDSRGRVRHDPERVGWHCFAGRAEPDCRAVKDDPTRIDEAHSGCGYRIILPLRLPPLRPGQ
jgi:hypothetical protein